MMWKFDKYKNKTAVLDDTGNKISYSELSALTDKFVEHCGRNICFNFCHNSIGSLAGYACMINAGIIPVMIADDTDRELLAVLMETYTPDFLWVPEEMASEFSDTALLFSEYGYCLLKTSFLSAISPYEELALLLTTSGSTGSPKLVRQSYKNIKANTESIVEYLKLDDTERPITTLPMNYTYGISIINSHLYVGATILLTDKTLMQKEFWQFFKSAEATSFGGVPYTYEMLKKLRFFNMDLPSLRTMTQAGGKLMPQLHKEFAEYAASTGRNFVVMYGQTEATARMAYLPPEMAVEKAGSMGIAIPGGQFSLMDTDGSLIEKNDVVGELVYEGDNVTLGYAEQRSDLEKGDERQGHLETGDMAKRDADGYYYIVGRKKRFLKMFGKRVNMDEVDGLIKGRFEGIECASAGIDDKMYIFVNNMDILQGVKEYIAGKLHLNASAIVVKYIPSIPKNEAGKTMYTELEAYYD